MEDEEEIAFGDFLGEKVSYQQGLAKVMDKRCRFPYQRKAGSLGGNDPIDLH